MSGWAALECGTLTIEPALVGCLVSTTSSSLRRGRGVEIRDMRWGSVWARCWVLKIRSWPSMLSGVGGAAFFSADSVSHLVGGRAAARVLRTSQWTRASL